jgi:uncharacterized protein (TIGR04222 family)
MDKHAIACYRRIQNFALDEPGAQYKFSHRLMRQNQWSREFAGRAIQEYKRFAFLGVAAGHPVTPSDQVDQVWHLHLTYTQSYWGDFCPNILKKAFHHHPTQGGPTEHAKHHDWYLKTLQSYERLFGEAPPADLWPAPEIRFGKDAHFVRVNTHRHWMIKKPDGKGIFRKSYPLAAVTALTLYLVGCQATIGYSHGQPANINWLVVSSLLGLLIMLLIAIHQQHIWVREQIKLLETRKGDSEIQPNVYETAILAEGTTRAVQAALASLIVRGFLVWDGSVLQQQKPADDSLCPLEREVLEKAKHMSSLPKIQYLCEDEADVIRLRLEWLGLLVDSTQKAPNLTAWIVPIFVSLFGLTFIGLPGGDGRLAFLIILFGLLAWHTSKTPNLPSYRSHYGDAVLRRQYWHGPSDGLQHYADAQLPIAVALHGITVLYDTRLAEIPFFSRPKPEPSHEYSGCGGGCGCGCGG